MRSKKDTKIEARARGAKPKPRPGGKALQRLFQYLGKRDPGLNDEVLAAVPVPKSARPRFGPAAAAKAAPARRRGAAARAPRARRPTKSAERFAKRIIAATEAKSRAARAPAAPGAPAAAAWQPLGPSVVPNGQTYGTARVDVIGRIGCIVVDPKDPRHLLCGAASGGIWESRDTGATWAPRSDFLPSLAIGAIAFDPNDSRVVYAGSGEGNFYFNLGTGLYRSNDGGTTWQVIATSPFIGKGFYDLVVDRQNSQVLYAATTGGFYVSTNGGSGWSLKRAKRCWDISIHPAGGAGAEILAAFADGLFVSATGGNSFTAVALPSAPTAAWERLAVDRVATAPDVVYVFGATSAAGHLWRHAGTSWTKLALPPGLNVTQAWYDWYVAATPDNPGQVYIGAIDAYRGTLTGSTWRWVDITTQGRNSIHPDQHCLAFSPGDSRILYAGNDGGIFRSPDSGATWKALNKGLGITEISYMGSDPNSSQWLMAGTQDNGTIRFSGTPSWAHIADGDGGDCGVNPLNPNEVYHSYYGVSLERSTNKGNSWTSLTPPNIASLFYPPVEVHGSTVAIGATSLLVSRNRGTSWLTRSLGLSASDKISAMHMIDANTIHVGTQLGRVFKVTWGGASWSVAALSSPGARYISDITADPSTPQRLWVTSTTMLPSGGVVYRSDNGGGAWVNRSAGLPKIPMNAVVVDPSNGKRVWVAGDVGVYQTLDMGSSWASFSTGLPNALAADLIFHKKDRKLICGLRNRGVWAIPVP